MGLRSRLVLSLTALALLAVLLEGLLGYWQFQQAIRRDLERDLERFARTVAEAVRLEPSPKLEVARIADLPEFSQGRLRLRREGEAAILETGGPFPENDPAWLRYALPLSQGFVLEAALDVRERQNAFSAYTQTLLISVPVALVVALGLAALLLGYLMRPLRQLNRATHELAQQRFPEAIPVPPGNDELAELAQSFNRMTQAVRGFLEREQSFTRYASHELRTPLATLRAQIESLEQGLSDPQQAMPYLKASLSRMEGTLSGLLILSRSPEPDPTPLRLEPLVRSCVAALPQAQQARLKLYLEGDVWSYGPAEPLRQAIQNLLDNACKFSEGEVEVRLEGGGGLARLVVRDRGPGVPEEALAELGKPFYRLDRRKQGLGLGLALVQHVARALSGGVEFRNLKPGLEATLTLPAASPQSEVNHVPA
ncbi:sensor histidine kinase [Calidithermus roseus]|uniref:histidine kinase n=1 Tax=Calidithermus roseus TaxID=1644118 RepID=A0A399EPU1_9DEIN|nr:HAMP domain-containing sensor histidine kinase [Calidithermus roseus]RIH84161.1 Sensor protein QseC [Calidithermus roseus]